LRDQFGFSGAEGFHKQPGAVERDRANEIGIIVINILPDEGGQLVRRNLEFRRWGNILRDSSCATCQQKNDTKKVTMERRHKTILFRTRIIVFDSLEEEK
jgi:hypothetical protein